MTNLKTIVFAMNYLLFIISLIFFVSFAGLSMLERLPHAYYLTISVFCLLIFGLNLINDLNNLSD